MNKALQELPEEMQNKLQKKDHEYDVSPMLATLTHDYFSDEHWIFERKLDGERCLLHKKNNEIKMISRNFKQQNAFYPEIVEALTAFPGDFILDAELVAFDGNVSSFSKLQNRMHVKNPSDELLKKCPVCAYVFDILYLDGYGLGNLPLRVRKTVLKNAFVFEPPHSTIRFLPHRNEKGEAYLKEACSKGWEGLIAKKSDSTYTYDRSKKWLKFKCSHQQEFVIGGYTAPEGERIGFGALLLGVYQNGKLKYCGRVGTGFDEDLLTFLHEKMEKIETDQSPFDDFAPQDDEIQWIEPNLVGEVGFTEWTDKNKLRHPRFLGLRKDKDPKDVHKEA